MGTLDVSAWRMQKLQSQWAYWLGLNWAALIAGGKVAAPFWLGAPADSGFGAIAIAAPIGQVRDWGLALTDGSRIHVHEYADGRRVVHRDAYNPDGGLGPMLAHLMHETPYGLLALGIGAAVLIAQTSDG